MEAANLVVFHQVILVVIHQVTLATAAVLVAAVQATLGNQSVIYL